MSDPSIEKGGRDHLGTNPYAPVRGLRIRALVTALASFAFGCLYFFVRQHFKAGVWRFDLVLANKALGAAALFLIALSMLLTGAAYFSRRWVKGLAHRKHHGLAGFWTGLAHAAFSHFVLPAAGLLPEKGSGGLRADAAGLAALVLFALMAVLSSDGARKRLDGAAWRKTLRYAGYAGLVLAGGHAALLKWGSWARYFRTFESILPSLSLPVVALAVATVLLRLAVRVAEVRKRR